MPHLCPAFPPSPDRCNYMERLSALLSEFYYFGSLPFLSNREDLLGEAEDMENENNLNPTKVNPVKTKLRNWQKILQMD